MPIDKKVAEKIKEKFSDTPATNENTLPGGPAPQITEQESIKDTPTTPPVVSTIKTPTTEGVVQGPQPKTEEQIAADKQSTDLLKSAKEEAARLKQEEEDRIKEEQRIKSGIIEKEKGAISKFFDESAEKIKKDTQIRKEKLADKYIESGRAYIPRKFEGVNDLAALLNQRGIENLKREGNTIMGEENGQRIQYSIDDSGNPIRTVLGQIDTEQELYAKEKNIPYNIQQGGIVFNPQKASDVMSILNKFPDAIFDNNNSLSVITGKAFSNTYGKYFQNPSKDELLEGLKTDDLEPGSIIWNKMIQANGGELTKEMVQAEAEYELDIAVDELNKQMIENINGLDAEKTDKQRIEEKKNKQKEEEKKKEEEGFSLEEVTTKDIKRLTQDRQIAASDIDKITKNYKEKQASLYDKMTNIKAESPKLEEAKDKLNKYQKIVDGLEDEREEIMDQVRKKYSRSEYSFQISMAQGLTEDVDKRLRVAKRDLREADSNFKYYDTENKARIENARKALELQLSIGASDYNTEVGLEEIKRKESQALIDGDLNAYRDTLIQKHILETQQALQDNGFRIVQHKDGFSLIDKKGVLSTYTFDEASLLPDELRKRITINQISGIGVGGTDTDFVDKTMAESYIKEVTDFTESNEDLMQLYSLIRSGGSSKTSNREQVMGEKDLVTAIVDGKNPRDVLEGKIKTYIELGDKNRSEKLQGHKGMLVTLNKLEKMFLRTAGKGGTNTGFINFMVSEINKFFGTSLDKDLDNLDLISNQMLVEYMKSISGVAISEQEAKRLKATMLTIKQSKERFRNTLEVLIDREREGLDVVLDPFFGGNTLLKRELFDEYYDYTYNFSNIK